MSLWVLVVIVVLWVTILQIQYFRFWRRWNSLVSSTRGTDLEQLLVEHMKTLSEALEDIKRVKGSYDYLEAMTTRSVQKVGLVRFNPFQDTGSDQSFALAILDLYDNGVVISGIHGREGTRVYAKTVEGGRSGHHLSEEESRAIKQAREHGLQSRHVAEEAHAAAT